MEDVSPFEPTVLGAMWKYRWLVLLIVTIFTALALVYAYLSPTNYQAVATLVVEDPRASALFSAGNVGNPQRYVADQAAILESAIVAERAAAQGESLEDAADVFEGLEVAWDNNSNQIAVGFTADTAAEAMAGANAVVEAYAVVRQEATTRDLEAALLLLDDSIAEVEAQIVASQNQIETEIAGDPARLALNDQLDEALARLVELQEELPDASGLTLDQLRAEVDDVSQQIATLQAIRNLDRQSPRLTALIEEQSRTINRKADLLQRKDELSVEARTESNGIVLSSSAIGAAEVGVDPIRVGAVGALLGLFIAAGIAYLLALRNRIFENRSQPELVLQAPVLAVVPNFREERIRGELAVRDAPASVSAEAFRFISAALDFESETRIGAGRQGTHVAHPDARFVRSFIVVSSSLGDGKTVVAANTALASARQGKRVLAVDADFGYQKLSSLLVGDVKDQRGLTDLVERGVPFREVVQRVPLEEPAWLDLVSRGSVGVTAPDFFRSSGVRAFFEAVREQYDLIIIDSPPMLHVAYSSLLVRYADRTIAVIRHGSHVAPAEELADRLDYLETEVLGYVYNSAPLREDMTGSYGSLDDVSGKKPK